MANEKRQRQKAGRQARIDALRAQQRREQMRGRAIRLAVFGAIAVALIAFLSSRGGDDDTAATTTTGPTTTTPGPTTTTAPVSLFGDGPCAPADGSADKKREFAEPAENCLDPDKTYSAEIDTSMGTFVIDLDATHAPATVNNFVNLARFHYFDGLTFHRVIDEFVIQGGDPNGDGSGGPGYKFGDELPPSVDDYVPGSVAMANSGPNTNGSQWFVWMGPNPLPGPSYSLFGQVTSETLDVVKDIIKVKTDAQDSPVEPVTIDEVTITEK